MTKIEFRGGMRQQFLSEKEDFAASYRLLTNARVRNNVVEPIKLPVEDLTLPAGLKQGIYTYDKYLLAFVAGVPYTREEQSTQWRPITGVTLSPTAPRIYVERIPGSYINFQRKGTDAALATEAPTRQSLAALICMDGETQPCLIFPDGSARATGTWDQWSITYQEYVPIGRFPMMHDGRLYCVIKDSQGRWTQIVGSVTGRPVDFTLLLSDTGDKAGALETEYGAPALAYAVSYDEVTALSRINTADGNFLVTTQRGSYLVKPNYDSTIAGEPTMSNQPLFAVGAIGPESITDLSGNTAVVSQEGIRTFNGVTQLKWEGRNDPIVRNIQGLFDDSLQTYGATVQFNNYVGFALKTVYGGGVVWWDDTLGQFVAVDLYKGASQITQFAVVNTSAIRALYFTTADNRLFKAFAGDFAECALTLHDIAAEAASASIAPQAVTASFIHSTQSGYWTASVVADSRVVTGSTRELAGVDVPAARGNASAGKILLPTYNAGRAGIELRWTGGAKLTRLDIDISTSTDIEIEPFDTIADQPLEELFILVSDDGVVNANRSAVHELMVNETGVTAFIGAGDHIYNSGTQAELDTNMAPYWNRARKQAPFYAAPGNHDNDTNSGSAFFAYMRQFPGRYNSVRFNYTEFFFFDTGLTTAGGQVNPENLPVLAESTQARWLINALQNSLARNRIVVWHHPAYSSGSSYSPGIAVMQPLLQRVKDAGATAVINGHTHLYERIVETIPQFTVGTGGHPLHGIGAINPNSKRILPTYGYLRLKASPVRSIFQFVDVNGEILDEYIA